MNYRDPREEEKKKESEKIFEEIIVENFPNMGKEIIKSRKCRESHTGYQGETHQDILIKLSKIKYKKQY